MTRCTFVLLITLGLLVVPLYPDAQPPPKLPRIGILEGSYFWEVFREALRDLGYVEGQTITLDARDAEGDLARLTEAAAELVRLPVDILVSHGTPATQAAMRATTTIPIITAAVGDPLRAGIVASLARPGGNVTGSTILGPELSAKRLQILQEALPSLTRLAFLWNPTNPANVLHFEDVQAGARVLGISLRSVEVRHAHEFDRAFAALREERPDALLITADPMHQLHIEQILALATKHRLPVGTNVRENVAAGALLSYGASHRAVFKQAAVYVDKILKGAKPGELPMHQPTRFELVINLKTAQALGLTIPPAVLFQADEVIR